MNYKKGYKWTNIGRTLCLNCLVISTMFLSVTNKASAAEGFSFESYNYPNRYIRHQSFRGKISFINNETDRKDATFIMVYGLANRDAISFESANYRGYYLRHRNYKIYLEKYQNTKAFKEDATFILRPGMADPTGFSFQSFNFKRLYIRHYAFQLELADPDIDIEKKDATFYLRAPRYDSGWEPPAGSPKIVIHQPRNDYRGYPIGSMDTICIQFDRAISDDIRLGTPSAPGWVDPNFAVYSKRKRRMIDGRYDLIDQRMLLFYPKEEIDAGDHLTVFVTGDFGGIKDASGQHYLDANYYGRGGGTYNFSYVIGAQ